MAIISATNIKDPTKKNELIHFAHQYDCKAFFIQELNGLGIDCPTRQKENIMKAKIKELAG